MNRRNSFHPAQEKPYHRGFQAFIIWKRSPVSTYTRIDVFYQLCGETLVADQEERDSVEIREVSPSGIRWLFEWAFREAPAPKN
jgi:hypothetical protein